MNVSLIPPPIGRRAYCRLILLVDESSLPFLEQALIRLEKQSLSKNFWDVCIYFPSSLQMELTRFEAQHSLLCERLAPRFRPYTNLSWREILFRDLSDYLLLVEADTLLPPHYLEDLLYKHQRLDFDVVMARHDGYFGSLSRNGPIEDPLQSWDRNSFMQIENWDKSSFGGSGLMRHCTSFDVEVLLQNSNLLDLDLNDSSDFRSFANILWNSGTSFHLNQSGVEFLGNYSVKTAENLSISMRIFYFLRYCLQEKILGRRVPR